MLDLDEMPRDRLVALLRNFAKNWLAHDGLWFQAVERAHGLEDFPTRCIACPPDPLPDESYCAWEFWIEEDGTGDDASR